MSLRLRMTSRSPLMLVVVGAGAPQIMQTGQKVYCTRVCTARPRAGVVRWPRFTAWGGAVLPQHLSKIPAVGRVVLGCSDRLVPPQQDAAQDDAIDGAVLRAYDRALEEWGSELAQSKAAYKQLNLTGFNPEVWHGTPPGTPLGVRKLPNASVMLGRPFLGRRLHAHHASRLWRRSFRTLSVRVVF